MSAESRAPSVIIFDDPPRAIFHYAQQYMQDGPITIKNASPSIVEIFHDLMVRGEHQPKDTPDGK